MPNSASTSGAERRNNKRKPRFLRQVIQLSYRCESGAQALSARILDWNDGGWGLELPAEIAAGTTITLTGGLTKESGGESSVRGLVAWCRQEGAKWRAGIALATDDEPARPKERLAHATAAEVDYYEILQLSPKADQETIQRVYRLLAQRCHPDNQESGDAEMFRQLLDAYRTLGDPEKRAAYDVNHHARTRLRWRIFDQPSSAQGIEAEKRKREGVLGLLYAKRANQPEKPALTLVELEDLLGVPREHLEFCLWYLKENGLAVRSDNGRHAITAKGVDLVEQQGDRVPLRSSHLLPEAQQRRESAAA